MISMILLIIIFSAFVAFIFKVLINYFYKTDLSYKTCFKITAISFISSYIFFALSIYGLILSKHANVYIAPFFGFVLCIMLLLELFYFAIKKNRNLKMEIIHEVLANKYTNKS